MNGDGERGLSLAEITRRSFETSKSKGWHDDPRSFGDLIALIHSELSEALEEFRYGHQESEGYYVASPKPEGVPIELADVIIRIGDLCGRYGIDLDRAVEIKLEYNLTRSHRHGGKVL